MRPIDAEKIKKALIANKDNLTTKEIERLIDIQPTLYVEPVKHGEWIYRTSGCPRKPLADGIVICPECRSTYYRIVGRWYNRCPNCGLYMSRGGVTHETD